MQKILRSLWTLALLLGALAPAAATAQDTALALYDGVVIDAAGGAAYVMSPGGGVNALDLATGNVLWNTGEAAKPLVAVENQLLAQAPSFEGDLVVVNLDSSGGQARGRTTIDLPAGVTAQVVDGPSRSFRVQAIPANGDVVLTWTADEARALQGLLPPEDLGAPGVDKAAAEEKRAQALALAQPPRQGAFRLDLKAGQAVAMDYDKAQALYKESPAVPRAIATKSAAPGVRQLVSLDGRHVLTSERSGGNDQRARYRWTVTDAAGATLGTFDAPVSMSPFVVAGSKLFYVAQPEVRKEGNVLIEEPLRLRALDVATGIQQWVAPVVDSNYRGPFPP